MWVTLCSPLPHLHSDYVFSLIFSELNKYYIFAKSSPPYITAVVLNPKFKSHYFEERWSEADVKQAREILESFWIAKYKALGPSSLTQLERARNEEQPQADDFESWMTVGTSANANGDSVETDELTQYGSTSPELAIADSRL